MALALNIPVSIGPLPPTPAPTANGVHADAAVADNNHVAPNAVNGIGPNAHDNHFAKLITPQAPKSTVPPTARPPETANKHQPQASAANGSDDSDTNTDNTANTDAATTTPAQATSDNTDTQSDAVDGVTTFLITQPQAESQVITEVPPPSATAAQNRTPDAEDTLASLQQLLQQLLNLAQQSGEQQPSDASTDTAVNATPVSPTASHAHANDTDRASQLIAQITQLLQPVLAQSGNAQDDGSDADLSVDVNANSGNSNASKLLGQLAQQLSQLLNSTGDQAQAPNAVPAASVPLPAQQPQTPANFGATLSKLLGSDDTKDELTSAIDRISAVLATANDPIIDPLIKVTGNKDGDKNSDANSAPTTPQVALPQAAPQAPATIDTGFAKLVQATPYTPVAEQVLVQVKNAQSDGSNEIKIQLHPADLGKVTVELTTGSDGKTGITVTADNRNTLAMLQNEARSLENALRDIGLKTDAGGLNFNLSGQQSQQQNPGKQGAYTQVAAIGGEDDSDYYSTASTIYKLAAQDGLDIRV